MRREGRGRQSGGGDIVRFHDKYSRIFTHLSQFDAGFLD